MTQAPLTDKESLERLLSSDGVSTFADHDRDGVADDEVVTEVITEATAEIYAYVGRQYESSEFANEPLVKRWATIIAATYLCFRRGLTIPESIAVEFDKLTLPGSGILPMIADRHRWSGRLSISRRSGANDAPSLSNMTIDRRRLSEKARVRTRVSTPTDTQLERDTFDPLTGVYAHD